MTHACATRRWLTPRPRHALATALLAAAGLALAESPAQPTVAPLEPPPSPPGPAQRPLPLPRSSIAAVLARRGALGLDEQQVRALEARDEALTRETAELRRRLERPPAHGGARPEGAGFSFGPGSGGHDGAEGSEVGAPGGGERGGPGHGAKGGRGGKPGGERRAKEDPAARSAAVRRALEDADTAAWLEAEALLPERLRAPAREVAARYREALADQQVPRPASGR